jgi:hypothetical protein
MRSMIYSFNNTTIIITITTTTTIISATDSLVFLSKQMLQFAQSRVVVRVG